MIDTSKKGNTSFQVIKNIFYSKLTSTIDRYFEKRVTQAFNSVKTDR